MNQSSSGMHNSTNVAVVTGCLGGVLLIMLIGIIFLLREKSWCCFRPDTERANQPRGSDSSREARGELRLIEGHEHQADKAMERQRGSPNGGNNQLDNTNKGSTNQTTANNNNVNRSSRLVTHSARRRELERANTLHYESQQQQKLLHSQQTAVKNDDLAAASPGPYFSTSNSLGQGPTSLLDMAAAAASNSQQISPPGSGPLGLQPLALNCLQVSQVPQDHYLPAQDMGDLTRGAALSILAWRDEFGEIMQRLTASGETLAAPVPDDPWYDRHRMDQSPRPSDARSETMSVTSSQDPYYSGVGGNLRSPVVSELSDVPVSKPILMRAELEGGSEQRKDADSIVIAVDDPTVGDDI